MAIRRCAVRAPNGRSVLVMAMNSPCARPSFASISRRPMLIIASTLSRCAAVDPFRPLRSGDSQDAAQRRCRLASVWLIVYGFGTLCAASTACFEGLVRQCKWPPARSTCSAVRRKGQVAVAPHVRFLAGIFRPDADPMISSHAVMEGLADRPRSRSRGPLMRLCPARCMTPPGRRRRTQPARYHRAGRPSPHRCPSATPPGGLTPATPDAPPGAILR